MYRVFFFMRITQSYNINNIIEFKQKISIWLSQYKIVTILDSGNELESSKYSSYNFLAAAKVYKEITSNDNNSFNSLINFYEQNKDWCFGFLSYDLKNELENLKSENLDFLDFPDIHFYIPQLVFMIKDDILKIEYISSIFSKDNIDLFFIEISNIKITELYPAKTIVKKRFSEEEYLKTVTNIKQDIKQGEIYELNFCQEFYAENFDGHPIDLYNKLIQISPTPFSCFYRLGDKYLISASPERFLKKEGAKIISQPIKGTKKRGITKESDLRLINELKNDEKEIAENVMIVDLVRNDLSKTAKKKSVNVEELCGIYPFRQVFQMISTVVSELNPKYHFIDAIKQSFPMGSMTGAPKIRAMQLIEKYEKTKRTLYSGSVGYINPQGDFDFNVIIRSMLYNKSEKYLSFTVGGAITDKSDAHSEYQECLLKAKAILEVLS